MAFASSVKRVAASCLAPFRVGFSPSGEKGAAGLFATFAGARGWGAKARLLAKAQQPGEQFRNAPYYDIAEPDMAQLWHDLIWPRIHHLDFSCVLDLAAGHGRNSARLREVSEHIIIVDINEENIEYCRARFQGDDAFTFLRNDGLSLAGVADATVSLVYSFDSMVHFDQDVVREYLREIRRVLTPGGSGFIHHSNYVGDPTGDFTKAPHWRNYMSSDLFANHCAECGLEVIEQQVIDWGGFTGLDCLSILRRPARSSASAA